MFDAQEERMRPSPVIIITGASSGIGEATARLFGRAGYRVVMAARRAERLQAVAEDLRAQGGEALPLPTDVSKLSEIHQLVSTTLEVYGQIDVLFNNAGLGRLDWLEALDPVDDILAQIEVNLLGVIYMTQAVLPHMIQRRSGHIINMSSVAGFIATPTYSIYAASKFGVRGFTEALRREVGIYNIRVSGIYPGGTETEFAGRARIQRKTRQTTPAALRLSSEEVAKAVFRLNRQPRRTLIQPWPMILAIWANRLLPGLMDRVIQGRFVEKER